MTENGLWNMPSLLRIMDSPKLLLKGRFSVLTTSMYNPENDPMGRPRRSWKNEKKSSGIGFLGIPYELPYVYLSIFVSG